MSKKQRTFTDKVRFRYWFFLIFDVALLLVPAAVYIIIALANGQITIGKKFICSFAAVVAIILTVMNMFLQKKKRSVIWIVLIGLYIAIKELLLPLIIMLGTASILDDFLLGPMIQHYKISLKASKVYDKRKKEELKMEEQSNG